MAFRLSRHAQEEIQRRRIPRDFLDAVLQTPQQIIDMPDGKKAYQSQVDFGGGRLFLVRAIVAVDIDPHLVVTVYRTSKISKYWRAP